MEINKLTLQEIQELDVHAAQRRLAENSNLLVDINSKLFEATRKLGEARIEVDQLKNDKSTVVEICRALKAVIQSG